MVINKPNCVFEMAHSSSIGGNRIPFIASTEKANCAHNVSNIKFKKIYRDANIGVVINLCESIGFIVVHSRRCICGRTTTQKTRKGASKAQIMRLNNGWRLNEPIHLAKLMALSKSLKSIAAQVNSWWVVVGWSACPVQRSWALDIKSKKSPWNLGMANTN